MVLKCEVCGGELEVNENLSVGKCRYCESSIVIPKDMEKKGNLYNRAVFLRQNNEFDKAMGVYEDILKDNNEEAEAYWGLVLSKYGIEYVDDPGSGEKKPTIHRIQNKSILEDADYQMAVKYADLEAGYQYEKEGKRINQILMHFLKIAKKESPYDVFICYKESDTLGNRTEDSIIAQDIYRELEREGYKVFFARKTLEGNIGEEYEPIIYAALSSAKVMLVIGTKAEHYQAVWVKNEWSRFSELKQTDEKKTIIPCYRDISPYELPMEIASYQALDVSKIGFLQDLIDGIGKVLSHRQNASVRVEKSRQDVDKLCKNAQTFVKLNQTQQALSIYKSITVSDPDDYRGWWGIASIISDSFSDYETTRIEEIKQNMNNAITVAEESTKKELQRICERYMQECERLKQEKKRIQEEQNRMKRKQELELRKNQLESVIHDYSDKSIKIQEVEEKIKANLQEEEQLKLKKQEQLDYIRDAAKKSDNIVSVIRIVSIIIVAIMAVAMFISDGVGGMVAAIVALGIVIWPIIKGLEHIVKIVLMGNARRLESEQRKIISNIEERETKLISELSCWQQQLDSLQEEKMHYENSVKELQVIEKKLKNI